MLSTDFTSGSRVTGVTVTFAVVNTFWALVPQGTCGWHRAVFTSALASEPTPVTLPGLAGGTAISMTLVANTRGSAAAPAATTASMVVVLAEAKTSAGAPAVIWVTSAELPAKLKVTSTPGFAASNRSPIVVNDSVSDAAASTVMSPDNDDPAADAVPLAAPPEPASPGSDPQAAGPRATTATTRAMEVRRMRTPPGARGGRWAGVRVSASAGSRRRRWWP